MWELNPALEELEQNLVEKEARLWSLGTLISFLDEKLKGLPFRGIILPKTSRSGRLGGRVRTTLKDYGRASLHFDTRFPIFAFILN